MVANREAEHTHQQNVFDPVLWLPVSLESVDTNGTILSHIGVEDLGQEETYRAVDMLICRHVNLTCYKWFLYTIRKLKGASKK